MNSPAVFIDKDGTLLRDIPYNVNPDKMVFNKGVENGLAQLAKIGVPLFVVSNQAGVALGMFHERALLAVETKLRRMFYDCGVELAGFYFCPHHPAGIRWELAVPCYCRKPNPGLLLKAAQEHNIELNRSWMIGDILDDVEAGHRAGCRSILIDCGNESVWRVGPHRKPDHIATDFISAVQFILSEEEALRLYAAQ